MSIQNIAFILGIAIGFILLLAVAVRYFQKGFQGIGDLGIAIIGLICLGLSIWKSVDIQAGDLSVKLHTLAAQVDTVAQEVGKAATAQKQTQEQLSALAVQLRDAPGAAPNFRAIHDDIERISIPDPRRMERVQRALKDIR